MKLKENKNYWLVHIVIAALFAIMSFIPCLLLTIAGFILQALFFLMLTIGFVAMIIMKKVNYDLCSLGKKPIWG